MAQNITPESLISILAAALAQKPTKPLVLALDGRCGRPACTRLGKNTLRQYGSYPSAGRSPAPGL